jgi:hypothetical protein
MNSEPEDIERATPGEEGFVGPSFRLSPREWLELAALVVLELLA